MKVQLIFDKKSYFSEGGVTTVFEFFDYFCFYTRIVVRVQKFSAKNRGSVFSPDFCASHPKKLF